MAERLFQSRWFHAVTIAVIALLTFIAYSNTFSSPFQFDDIPNIVENRQIRSLSNIPRILKGQRGVTEATFALNYAAGGLNVRGYHLVNLLIHIVNASLAYLFLYYAFTTVRADNAWARKVSAFSSLIFSLHPVQTQAVTYIVQRMESLSSLFYLLALISFIKSVRAKSAPGKAFFYGCVALSYALGFYSKEIAFTLPAVILLFDFFFISEGSLRPILRRWPLYAILAALLVFFAVHDIAPLGGFSDLSAESAAASAPPGGQAPHAAPARKEPSAGFAVKGISPGEYLLTEFNVLLYYLTFLALPTNQNLDYDYPLSTSIFETPLRNKGALLNVPPLPPVVPLVILLSILAFAVYALRRSLKNGSVRLRAVSFFIFWFFIILAPTSSLMPILDVIFEHRLYLPSLGYFTIAVISIDSLLRGVGGVRGGEAHKISLGLPPPPPLPPRKTAKGIRGFSDKIS